MKAVKEYTVQDLRAWAAKLDIAGRSAMKKDDLYAAIEERMDNCHEQALKMDEERKQAHRESQEILGEHIAECREIFEPLDIDPVYVTSAELLTLTGWKRLPRKYKKAMRTAGYLR